MSETEFFWCVRHDRVETSTDVCPASYTMGPYGTAQEAQTALQRVQRRNEEWEAEDKVWNGE